MFASATAAAKYLQDSAKSATSSADSVLQQARGIVKANTDKFYAKCSHCNSPLSVYGNLTSHNKCRICCQLFCDKCIVKSSFDIPFAIVAAEYKDKEPGDVVVTADKNKGSNPKGGIDSDSLSVQSSTDAVTTEADAITPSGTEDKPHGPLQLDGSSSSSSSSVTVPVTVTVPAAVPAAAPASAPAQSKKNVDRPRYICKHKCLLFARHVCMEAFKHEMTKKLQENFDDFLTSETRQNCYYPLPSKAPEDTAYRKAIRAAYLAEYVVDYVGLGTTYKALKYAYYGSEMFNIIASNGMLPIFAPLLEAMREFGITGPTALLRLYYLGCLHTLRDKINNAPRFLTLYAEAAHQPGVLCEKCPEPVLSYISQYLSPAHWMYLSSLPPPHNQGNEWGSWYLSQLIRRQGWTLLYCMNSSSQIPDGSKCPAFALLARCRRRSAVNSEDEAGRFGNPISPPPYAYSSSTGSRDEFGVGVSRGGEVGPDREVPIGVKRGVEGGPPYYDQEEEEEELVREALLVVRGSQSTMDWSINLQETIGDFDYLHIVDPAVTAAAVDTTGTADLTDMSSDLKDNPGIAGGGCRDSAGGSAGELRVSVVPGQVHEGIRAGALGILEGYAMRAYLLRLVAAGYRLKTVGHSLGAGVAVLIAAELRASIIKQNGAAGAHAPRYLQPLIQSVNSVVFACPACVSVNLAEAFLADKLLINTVLDSDIVSRFSFKTLEHLVTEIQDPAFVELSSSWMAQDKSRLTRYAASLGRASEIRSEAASLAAVEAEAAGAGFTGNITSPGVGAGTGTTGDSAEEDRGRDNESASEETSKEATQAPPKPPAGGGTAAAPASSRAGKSSGGLLSFIGSGTSNIYSFGTTTATTTKAAATTKATRIDAAPSGRAATSSITPPDRKENNVSMQTAKGGGGGGGGTGGGGGGGGGGTAPAMVTSTPVAGKPALVATAIYPPTAAATVKGTTVNADTAFDGSSGSVGGGGGSSSTVGDPLPSAPPAPIVTGKPLAVVFAEEANAPPGTSCAKATPAAGASASPRAGPSAGADAGVDAGTGAGAELKGYGSSEDDDDEGGDDDDDDGSEDDQDDTVKRSAVEKMKGQLADGDKKKKSDSKKDKVSKKMKKRTEAKIKAKKKKERVWTVCPGPIVHLYKEVDGTIRSAVVTHEHRVFQRMTLLPSKLLDDHLMQNIREGVRSALYSSTTPSLSATAALAPSASALTSTSTADASNQPPPKHEDCLSLQVPTTGTTVQGSSLNQNSAALEQQCPSQGNVADGARSRLVGAAAYFSAEVLATTPSRHGYKRPSIRSADGGRSTDGGDGGGGSDHLLSTRQHHASRQSIQDLRGYSASNTTSKDSAASRAKDIYSSFPCFHSPHLQLPPALAAAGTSGSHQEQEKLSKLHRQKTADGEQTLHPQQQEKQEKTAETKVVVEGVEARHWTSCGVCGIDVTWPYVLNSDAARARNAHHCGICGKVVCTLCSPAGDKLPGDGVNQYYELHDLRLAVPELGRFTPQRVCLLCYFDT